MWQISQSQATERSLYPSFLVKPPAVDSSYCVGVGMIKMIDVERRLFYIVTPVSPTDLKQVNTLVRGSLELPPSIIIKEATINTPYLTSDAISALGSSLMKGRSDLQRKKFQSANV